MIKTLSEAFDQFVTFGDIRSFQQKDNLVDGYSKVLSTGQTFSFDKRLLKKLDTFISSKVNDSSISNGDILFTIDPKLKRFKLPNKFESELGISTVGIKILDDKFAGFTSKTTTDTKSASVISGYNQGDIDEVLLGIGIYLFLIDTPEHETVSTAKNILGFLGQTSNYTVTHNQIEFTLEAKIKYPQIFSYLHSLSDVQFKLQFDVIQKFMTISSQTVWNDIKKEVNSGEIFPGSKITVSSAGASDSKLDKSDWKISVENSKTSEITKHNISVKSNNKTFHRFSCLNLKSTLDFLNLFGIIVPNYSQATISRMIDSLKSHHRKQTTYSNTDKNKTIKLGKELCSYIDTEIQSQFDNLTAKEKVTYFIIDPLIHSIKGTDKSIHNEPLTIADIKNNKITLFDQKNFMFSDNNKNSWNTIGKQLSIKHGYDIDGYPYIFIFNLKDELYRIRFTKSHLFSNSPKIVGMFEILDIVAIKTILTSLTN